MRDDDIKVQELSGEETQGLFSEKAERGFNKYMNANPFIIFGFMLKIADHAELFEEGMKRMQTQFTPEELGVDASIGLGLIEQARTKSDRRAIRSIRVRKVSSKGDASVLKAASEGDTPTQNVRRAAEGIEILGEVFLAIQEKLDNAGDPFRDDFMGMAMMRKALREAAGDIEVFSKDGVCIQPLQGVVLDLAGEI